MNAPPTWFDFSTDCIFTAQKHKKHKAWRDGICTCVFVRGWVVLRLYPEGVSTTTEPLEEWRIPPGPPARVSRQEIELQVHLVQLLGHPEPLRGPGKSLNQQTHVQIEAEPPQHVPSQVPKSAVPGGPAVLPRRRLPGGLFRPKGLASPHGLTNPPVPYLQSVGCDLVDTDERASNTRAQPQRLSPVAKTALFVPPLLSSTGDVPIHSERLPFEVAWGITAARAVLLLNSPCCGSAQCTQCYFSEVGTQQASETANLFKALFSSAAARSQTLLLLQNECPQLSVGNALCKNTLETRGTGGTFLVPGDEPSPERKGERVLSGPQGLASGVDGEGDPCSISGHSGNLNDTSQRSATYSTAHDVALLQRAPSQPTPITPACLVRQSTSLSVLGNDAGITSASGHTRATLRCGENHLASSRQPKSKGRFLALAGGAVPHHRELPTAGNSTVQESQGHRASGHQQVPPNGSACSQFLGGPPRVAMGPREGSGNESHGFKKAQQQQLPCEQQQHQHQQLRPPQKQQLPSEHQQQQLRTPQQHESAVRAGSASSQLPQPVLLLAESLPQTQAENFADRLPVTFSTAADGASTFNATLAAASHLIRPPHPQRGAVMRAKDLALYLFNCVTLSLQGALSEVAQDSKWTSGRGAQQSAVCFLVEGARIRGDKKRSFGFQQKTAQVQNEKRLKQRRMKRDHQRRHRRRASGYSSNSASSSDEEEDIQDSNDVRAEVFKQAGLLLDLSSAHLLPGPPHTVVGRQEVREQPRVLFASSSAVKARLGRNDIWALSTDGRFDDWSKVVLVRSAWRGVNPHSQCIKVSVIGPWPSTQVQTQLSLLGFFGGSQPTSARLPPPPPLLLQIQNLLHGGGQAIDGVHAVWVGRFQNDIASIEGCARLFKAEASLYLMACKNVGFSCPEAAALEAGAACTARALGIGFGTGVPKSASTDSKLSQAIQVNLTSKEAEDILHHGATAGGTCILNREQQQILLALAGWFSYSDGRRPFACLKCAETPAGILTSEEPHADSVKPNAELRCTHESGESCSSPPHSSHCETGISAKPQEEAPPKQGGPSPALCGSASQGGHSSTCGLVSLFGVDDGSDLADDTLVSEGHLLQQLQTSPLKPTVRVCKSPSFSDPGNPGITIPTGSDSRLRSTNTNTLTATEQPPELGGQRAALPDSSGAAKPSGDSKAIFPRAIVPKRQASVLLEVAAAAMPVSSAPVLLVQGVFGAGKSTILAACLSTLCRLLDASKSRGRVLMVCATNTAVDGVLLRLLRQFDYRDFARIGRLSEMQPALLPYAVSSSADRRTAVQEFKSALSQVLWAGDTRAPLTSMARDLMTSINDGSFPPSVQRWKRRRIWATTCSAAASSDLFSETCSQDDVPDGTTSGCFPFLLMDEASQVGEPLAVSVLTRARALRFLLFGDTRQLPPTSRLRGSAATVSGSLLASLLRRCSPLASGVENQNVAPHRKGKGVSGELQTLQATGGDILFCPFQMRVQYRCHPELGRLAAELFYGPWVVHGVTAEQRVPPIPEWGGPLCCAVVRGGRESKACRSLLNVPEARAVARLVHCALRIPVQPSASASQGAPHLQTSQLGPHDLGVICFYRSQVEEVRRQLFQVLPREQADAVQVSTVDAFQGSEKDVILLSLVRAQGPLQTTSVQQGQLTGETVDFLSCPQRVCVALTRARRQLVVVGAESVFRQHRLWSHVYSRAVTIHVPCEPSVCFS